MPTNGLHSCSTKSISQSRAVVPPAHVNPRTNSCDNCSTVKQRAMTKRRRKPKTVLEGKRVAFFGSFSDWPAYHGGTPERVAVGYGAVLTDEVDERLDILVLGSKRARGRAEAKKKAEQLCKQAAKIAKSGAPISQIRIMDETEYRELVRVDLRKKRFAFCGGFDCCPADMVSEVLSAKVTQLGGTVQDQIDAKLDYLVVGNRRAKGKTAALREAEHVREASIGIPRPELLSESAFLELARSDSVQDGPMDFAGFVGRLHDVGDEPKMQKALKMLQKERMQLYASAYPDRIIGVVQSQRGRGIYAPWITDQGNYGCATPDLEPCMGLNGSMCKHLFVLLMGLVRSGGLDAPSTSQWLQAAKSKGPKREMDLAADAFLQYRGAQAGEIDWRPTETIPEDFIL